MNSQVVPFTMVSTQQFFKAGENKRPPRANITRFQRSDGNWKEVVTYYNEDRSIRGTTTTLGITGRGVFKVNDDVQKLFFLSPMYHASHEINEDQLRKTGQFARDAVVLGFPVIVQRTPSGDETGYTEFYLAPSLGGTMVRQVVFHADGSYSVVDAETIKVGEPSESEFGVIPNYPVDYALYERFIKDADSQGDHELANKMRQVLEQQKAASSSGHG
ncbi:MAG TPA: hypothetical protein VN956_02440 [Pyrinomonadaceae bacterium]|nr:hypothetical protein [Pyrinomonadaceae bacterium]